MTGTSSPIIRRGQPADWVSVVELLQRAQLPTEDLTRAPDLALWVLEIDAQIAGAVALEGSRPAARLLRSLVVAPGHRQRGLGQALVARVEREARGAGTEQLVLLTETAQAFFQRLGYQVIERAAVPERLRQSAEFRTLCPASAVCLAKRLVA